ncbi:CLUMA_CG011574, isoform A [Clunio marinus]|uniref:CLUMA_CG011574, isoform A n=1 Tax=Clunio marinus TaxID=568069 RepID=A0A1J1IDB8_9DIPT|nr:CLUMA_CG011574, isoform A [Clunio marinus]
MLSLIPYLRSKFNFDLSTLDYHRYIKNWVIGARRFMLKLDDNTIPEAKRKFHFLFWLDFSVKILFYMSVGYLTYRTYMQPKK